VSPNSRYSLVRIALFAAALNAGAAIAQSEPSRPVTNLLAPTLADQDDASATVRFLEELADRRLERSIVAWAEARLARTPSRDEQLSLVLAALRARRSLALDSAPESRDGLWDEATRRQAEYLETLPEPDQEAIRLDALLSELDRAMLEARLAMARASDVAGRQAARTRLLAVLERLDEKLSGKPKTPGRAAAKKPPASQATSSSSRRAVATQRFVERDIDWGWLSLATCSTDDQTLRQIAARRASDGFEHQLTRSTTGEMRAAALLGRAMALACLPESSEANAAAQRAEAAVRDHPELADRWLAWKLSLAGTAPSAALLEQARVRLAGDVAPHVDLAFVEFDLLRSAAADGSRTEPIDPIQRKAFEAQLADVLSRFDVRYRPRWGQIAQVMAQRLRLISRLGERVAEDVEQAEVARTAGDRPTAVAAYRRAISTAALEQRPDALFELRSQAGSVLIEAEQWDAAAAVLKEAASNTSQARSAEAHLLACYALGRATDISGQRAEWISALDNHLARFAGNPTALEAWWQRGQAALADEDWAVAIAALQHVPANHRRAASVLEGLVIAYRKLLSGLAESADERRRVVADARVTLEPRLNPITEWGEAETSAALFLAETSLQGTTPDYDTADRWLKPLESLPVPAASAMTSAGAAEREARLATISRLRILTLAGKGEIDAAQTRLTALNNRPEALLEVMAGLHALASARPEARAAIARLERDAALRLDATREALAPPQRIELDRALAAACLAMGDRDAAILRYRRVIEAVPNDRPTQAVLAGLLADSAEIALRSEAIALYRKLESSETAGSIPWLEYRLAVCRTLARDDRPASRKLAQVTRLLYPKPGTPELAAAFAELATETPKPGPNPSAPEKKAPARK
jgi:hypothetical protein